ncbi:MAG TPA: NB-ARC domain-containing protein, partial [Ktedonobacteraceae bacterium]|nr:NB-ARC domain-containing protein [Ktedonobacteraceae bacterium]
TVRRRILLLSWLLCKTPRDLRAYVKAAGFTTYSDEEQTRLHVLSEHLTALHAPPPLLLPARPRHLKGRDTELEQVLLTLGMPETRILALTGMPGVGKSTLAYETLHRLATVESKYLRYFPDGIATFTCTGRQGTRGLISLLTEITALFTTGSYNVQGSRVKRQARTRVRDNEREELAFEVNEAEPELASVMDRARAALANKRALLLLDDLDPAFPLRQAMDALLSQDMYTRHEVSAEHARGQRVILTTGQFVPSPALISTRLHIQPLRETAALELLSELLGAELSTLDLSATRQACAAVGYLPLALEGMATAVQANGIPLTLVAAHLIAHPLGGLLNSEEDVVAKIAKALASLEQEMRVNYLLLAALELSDFDLETAAAALAPQPESADAMCEATQTASLAHTAAILGQFVRLSLLELAPNTPGNAVGYHMHPLLYHHARAMAHTLSRERVESARHNLQTYTHLALNQRIG